MAKDRSKGNKKNMGVIYIHWKKVSISGFEIFQQKRLVYVESRIRRDQEDTLGKTRYIIFFYNTVAFRDR